MKSKLQIRKVYSEECKQEINALYVDDDLFDYLLDEASLRQAKTYCNDNPHLKKAVHGDILNHFLECFKEFVGREVKLTELLQCIKEGEIDVLRG